jgi:hypothetical protein
MDGNSVRVCRASVRVFFDSATALSASPRATKWASTSANSVSSSFASDVLPRASRRAMWEARLLFKSSMLCMMSMPSSGVAEPAGPARATSVITVKAALCMAMVRGFKSTRCP